MMRPTHLTHLAMIALLLGLGACAALRPELPVERDAVHRLERGLAALDAAQYRAAFDDLAWVYTRCEGHARGAEALAALAALELDPRNRAGRPGVGTDLLARLLRGPAAPDWVRPLGETGYLLALALGAPPADTAPPAGAPLTTAASADAPVDTAAGVRVERAQEVLPAAVDEPAHGCGPSVAREGWVAASLPELPGPSLMARLAEAESGRAAALTRADTLAREAAELRRRLEETQAELERIRKTLKP